jgi:Glycosyl transferase family 11
MNIQETFSEILFDRDILYEELLKMTLTKHQKGIDFPFHNSISVHVRLGDFAPATEEKLRSGVDNHRIPISWYVQQVQQIRDAVDSNISVYVFSDGHDFELQSLLSLPNTQRKSFGSSIADLLALSSSNVLIASGSTFSQWASYLGRMPVIWHKGQLKNKLYYENGALEIECDEFGKIPDSYLEGLVTHFKISKEDQIKFPEE